MVIGMKKRLIAALLTGKEVNKRFLVFLSSRKSWTLPYIIFSAIFVVIPLFLIVVYAFTDDNGHLTLANFQKFFEHPEAINTTYYYIIFDRFLTCMFFDILP